jgi:hypothetical protein
LDETDEMLGAIILAVVIVIAIPVGLFLTGAIAIAVIGNVTTSNAEATHEGSELIELNE